LGKIRILKFTHENIQEFFVKSDLPELLILPVLRYLGIGE